MKSLKIILLLYCCVFARLECRASCTLNQSLITNIPSAIEISNVSSTTSGTISPETGQNSGVGARFKLKTNSDDTLYDYIVEAKVATQGGTEENAFGMISSTPFLIFGNSTLNDFPTISAINNIKTSPTQGNNPNAIAYPISANVESLQQVQFANSPEYGGYHFKVSVGDFQEGFVRQTVGTMPISGSYFYGEDKPGVYQVVLKFTAFRKP